MIQHNFTGVLLIITILGLSHVTQSQESSVRLKRQQNNHLGNRLDIKPSGPHHKPVGKNLFFTCKAEVSNPSLVRDLKWLKPNGQNIPEDDRVYTEEQPGDAAIMLFIKNLREDDSGAYICKGIYANNEQLMSTVQVSTFIGITWEDAPTDQHAVISTDYKIRCVVKASPPATIDWLKESLIVSTGDRYVIESDGLLIKHVTTDDAGTYTCRARVSETGNLEERDIKLEVQVPPEWAQLPGPVKGIEQEKVEFECLATGMPHPYYTWVDWEGKDATERDGWTLEKDTGHLIAYHLKKEDEGKYVCIAENNAGRIETETFLDVIIKPRVQELYNKTYPINKPDAKIVCKASGDPVPEIIWRKWSRNEPFIAGGQPDDDRIYIENRVERAPDYTETGEVFWRVSELNIHSVQRKDDGLYECQARNEGGQFFKSGHIQVEFAPTFEEQPMYEQWSWDQNPVNLTCIATGIPNATITWWVRDREINREIIDRNMQVVGHGPRSDLIITPLDIQYYGRYTCKAVNPHGEAFFEIDLKEAREPSYVQQAVTDKVTATTIMFRFIAPTNTGGLPIESYAVEYKEATQQWQDARRRVWPSSSTGFYVLEGLQPKTTYDFRFGAKNLVGFSEWGAGQQFTMPQRGPPEPPIINTLGQYILDDDVLNLTSPDKYELVWYLPEDNGEPIDFFEISFYPVGFDAGTQTWNRRGDLFRTEVPHPGNVRYVIQNLYANTHYLIEIRAHNHLGFSTSSRLVIKTARGSSDEAITPPYRETKFETIGIIIGSVVAILFLGFCLVDVLCCKINNAGITYIMFKTKGTREPDIEKNKKTKKGSQSVESSAGFKSAKSSSGEKTSFDKNRQQKKYSRDHLEVGQSSAIENGIASHHIFDVAPLLDAGEELIGKHWSTDAVLGGRERMFKPAASKAEQNRGFVNAKSKVAQIRPRQISGTRSELNLLDQFSHSYDTPPIHKSKSEWIITPCEEARPFRNGKKKNRYDKNEPIYATPSLPSLTHIQVNASVHQNDHYYSIPNENLQYETPINSGRKTSLPVSQQGQVFGQKPKPILKSVPTPNVTKTFSPNQTGSKGPNLPNRNTMPADILIPCQDSRIPYQSQSNNSEKDKLSQSQGPVYPGVGKHGPEKLTITVNLIQPKTNLSSLNSSKSSKVNQTPQGPEKRGKRQTSKQNGNESFISDLGKLTECSRLLAHSNEDLISRLQESDGLFDTDTSMTSSNQTPNYEDDDHLDLSAFHKTQDFGDFQIMTDSPKRPFVQQPSAKRSTYSRGQKLKF